MNEEHMNQWLTALRSGEFTQGTSCLAMVTDPDNAENDLKSSAEFCCLGVAAYLCESDIRLPRWTNDGVVVHQGGVCFDGDTELAPGRVANWLGFPGFDDYGSGEDRVDFLPDWGGIRDRDSLLLRGGFHRMTVSRLNDTGMTFAQIADVLDYFGIAEVI